MDCVGLVLLAKWARAALAFALASFSLVPIVKVPSGLLQPKDSLMDFETVCIPIIIIVIIGTSRWGALYP